MLKSGTGHSLACHLQAVHLLKLDWLLLELLESARCACALYPICSPHSATFGIPPHGLKKGMLA